MGLVVYKLASIIIPTWNRLYCLQRLIKSIEEKTSDYELIVINNEGKDGTTDWLKNQSNIKEIFNPRNAGYSYSVNQGLAIAEGEIFVVANDDTIVSKDWLTKCSSIFERYPFVGEIGPISYPRWDHPVQYCSGLHRGRDGEGAVMKVSPYCTPELIDHPWNLAHVESHEPEIFDLDYAYGFFWIVRREVNQKLRDYPGIHPNLSKPLWEHPYLCGEDLDYSNRVKELGYRVVCANRVHIWHAIPQENYFIPQVPHVDETPEGDPRKKF